MSVLNICSDSSDKREKDLSKSAEHAFIFDGVTCCSLESVLQAFKTPVVVAQKRICNMPPIRINKLYKKAFDKDWQARQQLWWQGTKYDRCSDAYHMLITRLFNAMFEHSESYRDALLATTEHELEYTDGKHDPFKTVLTTSEFLYQVYRLRSNLN